MENRRRLKILKSLTRWQRGQTNPPDCRAEGTSGTVLTVPDAVKKGLVRQNAGPYLDRNQFRRAAGVLHGLDSVFGRESSHKQCQLTVGCHHDGGPIKPLDVLRSANTATVHFYDELSVIHEGNFILR